MARIFLFFALIPLLLSGCVKNEFTLDFRLAPEINGTYRFLYHASSSRQSFIVESVAVVNAGKGNLTSPAKNPTVLYIFSPSSNEPRLVCWVEGGTELKFSGDSPDPIEWKAEGNRLTEAISNWRLENLKILKTGNSKEINTAVARYVMGNKDNPLSSILLLTYFDRREDESRFLKLWNSLEKGSRRDEIFNAVAPADIQEDIRTPGKINGIVVVPYSARFDSVCRRDTLPNPRSDAKLSLIYFRINDSDGSVENLDTLKSLRDKYDSKTLGIAEVSLEGDSMVWSNSLRMDTLNGIDRYWLPGGINNPRLPEMGVRRADFFVLADRKGKLLYRGGSVSEAAGMARKRLGK